MDCDLAASRYSWEAALCGCFQGRGGVLSELAQSKLLASPETHYRRHSAPWGRGKVQDCHTRSRGARDGACGKEWGAERGRRGEGGTYLEADKGTMPISTTITGPLDTFRLSVSDVWLECWFYFQQFIVDQGTAIFFIVIWVNIWNEDSFYNSLLPSNVQWRVSMFKCSFAHLNFTSPQLLLWWI